MKFRFGCALLIVPLVGIACAGRFDFEPTGAGGLSAGGNTGTGGISAAGGYFAGEDYLACFLRCAAAGLQCQASNFTCVECTSDSHCEGRDRESAVCLRELGNRCARCEYNGHCGDRNVCVDAAHACAPRCDEPDDQACDGFGARGSCNLSRGYCEGCRSDDDCSALPATPHCSLARLGCVACTSDEQCAAGKFCDPVRNECVACRDSRDCPVPGQLCDPSRHTCG
jgi:hypothetical protein